MQSVVATILMIVLFVTAFANPVIGGFAVVGFFLFFVSWGIAGVIHDEYFSSVIPNRRLYSEPDPRDGI